MAAGGQRLGGFEPKRVLAEPIGPAVERKLSIAEEGIYARAIRQ